MNKQITYILLLLVFIAGCKKYEDGPWLSLRTKYARITGKWEFEYFGVNGIDSTSFLKSNFSEAPYYSLGKKNNRGDQFGSLVSGHFRWDFSDHHNNLTIYDISVINGVPIIVPYNSNSVEWEILRLTNKELWLKTNSNQKQYIAHLIKTKER